MAAAHIKKTRAFMLWATARNWKRQARALAIMKGAEEDYIEASDEYRQQKQRTEA